MPYSGSTYTMPAGATTVVTGNIIQSASWNSIHTDIQTALTQVMSQLVAISGSKNILSDNGGLEIWQRGGGANPTIAVAASNTLYTADRWYLSTGANQGSSVNAVTGITNGSQYAAQVIRTAGQTGVPLMIFAYPLEVYETDQMQGNKITLTFSVKAGANFSPASGTLTAIVYLGAGAASKRNITPFAGETAALTVATNITTAVTRISATSSAVVPLTATVCEIQFNWTPVGTAGADDSFTIDDVQLEINSSSTTWTPSNFDRTPFTLMLRGCKSH